MNYTAYTTNTDGSINVLAGSTNPAVFAKILPTGTQYEVHEGETYTAGGKTWLSDTEQGYIDAKAAEEKQKKLAELDAQYQKDKREIMGYYNEAIFYGDEDLQAELKEEMANVDKQYEEDRKAIEEE